MTTKRLFRIQGVIIFIAVLSMVLAGCGGSGGSNGNSGSIKTDFGVSNNTINLGVLTPLTGPVAAPIGIPLTKGIEVYFKHVNDNGGIDGFKVNLVEKDTKYDPTMEVEQYNAIHNQVLMLAESLGTPTTFAIKDLSAADNMLVSAATLSSELAYVPNLILVGTPYRLQVDNAFDYVVNQLHIQNPKTGIIYQNDDYGLDGLSGYLESVKAYGLDDVGQASFAAGQTDESAEVLQLKAAGAQYVFLTSTPADTATIMLTAHALGYDPQWILQSPAYSTLLLGVPGLAPLLEKAWLVGQGALWGVTKDPTTGKAIPGMAQLLADVQKYAPDQKPDGFFEFGYTEAWITYAILKKAADSGDLTRAGLVNAFNSLQNVDLGGLYPTVSYGTSPNQRVPTRDNTIFAIDPTVVGTVKALTGDFTGTAAANADFTR